MPLNLLAFLCLVYLKRYYFFVNVEKNTDVSIFFLKKNIILWFLYFGHYNLSLIGDLDKGVFRKNRNHIFYKHVRWMQMEMAFAVFTVFILELF